MIIAGGTGVLPFLDFLYFVLKNIAHVHFKAKNPTIAEKLSLIKKSENIFFA